MATGLQGLFAPLPGTSGLPTLKRRICAYVGLPDDPSALTEAEDAIDSALNHLNTRPWRWAVAYDDITTVLDDADYDFPRDLGEPYDIERLNGDGNPDGRIPWKDPKTFLVDFDRVTGSGTPKVYTILERESGLITLDRPPDQSFVSSYPTLRLWYLRNAYRNGSAVDVPAHIEHFVLWYARWEMAMIHGRDRVDSAERAWTRIWQEIIRKDNAEVDF
jgi:hypothetical protein